MLLRLAPSGIGHCRRRLGPRSGDGRRRPVHHHTTTFHDDHLIRTRCVLRVVGGHDDGPLLAEQHQLDGVAEHVLSNGNIERSKWVVQ